MTQQDPTSNVHPADVRRMMSNGNKKKESTSTPSRAANSVRWAANTASQNPSDVWGGATETSSHSGSKSGSSRSVSSALTNSSQKPPPLLNRAQAMARYSDDSTATSDPSLPSLMDRHKSTYSDDSTATPDPYSVDEFDLFGTRDVTHTPKPSRASKTGHLDPFTSMWAEDDQHHFW